MYFSSELQLIKDDVNQIKTDLKGDSTRNEDKRVSTSSNQTNTMSTCSASTTKDKLISEDDIKKKMVSIYRPSTVDELKVAANLVKKGKIKKKRSQYVSIYYSELNDVDGNHITDLSSFCNDTVMVERCSPLLPFLSNVKCKMLLLCDMTISSQEWENAVQKILQNVEILELRKIMFNDSVKIKESIAKNKGAFECKEIRCTYSSYKNHKDLLISCAKELNWKVIDDNFNEIKMVKRFYVF